MRAGVASSPGSAHPASCTSYNQKLPWLEPFFCCVSFTGCLLRGTHAPRPILHQQRWSARRAVSARHYLCNQHPHVLHLHWICFWVASFRDSVHVRLLGNAVSHPAPKELSLGIGSDKKRLLRNEGPSERTASFLAT